MKTFEQLTPEQQKKAVEKATDNLLTGIVEGYIRFNDEENKDSLQARIDEAWEKAEKMQTPWFAHEYIMESCGEEIRGMAQCDAEDALYAENETVIYGIA